MSIINVGTIYLEHFLNVDSLSSPTTPNHASACNTKLGGFGLNQSRAICASGVTTHHIGAIGSADLSTYRAIDNVLSHTDSIKETNDPTGIAIHQICQHTGTIASTYNPSANANLVYSDTEHAISIYDDAYWIVLTNEFDYAPRVVELASQFTVKPVLYPFPLNRRLRDIDLSMIHTLVLNRQQLQHLAGIADYESALNLLVDRFPKLEIVLMHNDYSVTRRTATHSTKFNAHLSNPTQLNRNQFEGYFTGLYAAMLEREESFEQFIPASIECAVEFADICAN